MGPVDVTTNPILHSVVSNQEMQEKDLNALNANISNKLNTEFSNIDVINQSGVIGGCQIAPRASFRESFIYILTRLLEILHLYHPEVNEKFIPHFHDTLESEDLSKKTWIAVTSFDSYVKIERLDTNRFKETQVYRESNEKREKVREFAGSSAQEFMRLLLEHDEKERTQKSEITVNANTLKRRVVENNLQKTIPSSNSDKQTESKMIELLRDQEKSVQGSCLFQSDIKELKVTQDNFSSLLSDVGRFLNENSSTVSCCGKKLDSGIIKMLIMKINSLLHKSNESSSKTPSYEKEYEELFEKVKFTSDDWNNIKVQQQDSPNSDGIDIPEEIESCLSSSTGIGNFFYACSQIFYTANSNAVSKEVGNSVKTLVEQANNYPGFFSLCGKNNLLFVDFSEREFTQTLYVLSAVVNDNNETFDIANYIYTTKGTTNKDTTKDIDENDIHNDAKDDENNSIIRRRNFSGEIAIVAYT